MNLQIGSINNIPLFRWMIGHLYQGILDKEPLFYNHDFFSIARETCYCY